MNEIKWNEMTTEELATEYFLILSDIMLILQTPFETEEEQLEAIEAQVRQVPQFKEV